MPKYQVELSDGRKFVVEADAPPSEQDVLSALGPQKSEAAAAAPKAASFTDQLLADNPALPPLARGGLLVGRLVKANPVGAAALAGSALAAPFTGGASIPAGMAAAGLGGAGGAGLALAGRQIATGRPESAESVVGEMTSQGAGQAIGQGIGAGVAKIAGAVAPRLLKGILRPSRRVQEEYGDVIATGLRERIPVGQSGEAVARMRLSAKQADDLIAAAESAGAPPIKPKEVTGELRGVADTLKRRAQIGLPDETADLAERGAAFYRANKQGIPLTQAQGLKREAQDMASRTFRAIEQGNPVKDTTALADRAIATGLKKAIETRAPGVQAVNTRTQELMGLTEALEAAEARSGGVVGLNPANWMSGLAPGLGSRAAFGIDRVSRAPLPGGGRAMLAALLSLMGDDQK